MGGPMQGPTASGAPTGNSPSGKTGLGTTLGAIALVVAIAAVAINFVVPGPKGATGPQGTQGPQGQQGPSTEGSWAVVNSTGALVYGNNAVSADQIATGQYDVLFDQNVSACGFVANVGNPYSTTDGLPGWITVAGMAGDANGVYLRVTNFTGSVMNDSFDLGVFCGASGLWAVVNSAGDLVRGSNVVSAGSTGLTGHYGIIFNQNVTRCDYVATLGTVGSSGIAAPGVATVASRTGNADGVFVATYNTTGIATDASFDVVVECTSPTWAVIDSSGNSVRGSDSGAVYLWPGGYEIDFTQDVSACAYVASPGETGSLGAYPAAGLTVVGRSGNADAVFLGAWDLAGVETNESFQLIVLC